MRILFLCSLFLIPALSFSQGKAYFTISPVVYLTEESGLAIGGQPSGNFAISSKVYVGFESGLLKYGSFPGLYNPIQFKMSYFTNTNPSKSAAMFFVQPGYGAYTGQPFVNGGDVKGGFCFYGGAGVRMPSKSKIHGFINIGYSVFGFTVNEKPMPEAALGVKFGLLLR